MAEPPRSSQSDLSSQAANLADDVASLVSRAVEPFRRNRVFYVEGLCTDWISTSPSGTPGHLTVLINNTPVENVLWNRPRVARADVIGRWVRVLVTPQRIVFDDIIPGQRAE